MTSNIKEELHPRRITARLTESAICWSHKRLLGARTLAPLPPRANRETFGGFLQAWSGRNHIQHNQDVFGFDENGATKNSGYFRKTSPAGQHKMDLNHESRSKLPGRGDTSPSCTQRATTWAGIIIGPNRPPFRRPIAKYNIVRKEQAR